MIKNKEKQFDCIKIKDSVQAQINAETQSMTKDELLKYFNRNTQKQQSLNSDFVHGARMKYNVISR
jgi:hypothetical protein